MKRVRIFIELNGDKTLVGYIQGEDYHDARFSYCESYLEIPDIRPISLSLPLKREEFTPLETKNFFEGLLPEGFSRKAIAGWVKADEDDYITILEKLGRECLGAIQILSEEDEEDICEYELLSEKQVQALAAEGATKSTEILLKTHLSLTGASGKAGLYYDKESMRWYLPKGNAASTHIVKQSHIRLDQIVLNEQLCMLTAKKIGIDVPNSFIINLGDGGDSDVLFATERYDRKISTRRTKSGVLCPLRLHQEDFSQALGIPASKKYEKDSDSYMKRMFKLLSDYSSDPIKDQLKLWDRIVFNYFIGNTDCHIKNFALVYSDDFKKVRLAPAYDILCTQVYESTQEMSFYIGGEIDITRINRDSFVLASKEVGVGEKLAMKHYDDIALKFEDALTEAALELEDIGFVGANNLKDRILRSAIALY